MLAFTQLICFQQDIKLLDLLLFPNKIFIPQTSETKIKYWTYGKTRYSQAKNISSFICKANEKQINYIEVSYEFSPYLISDGNITLLKVVNKLSVSPTSSIWKSTMDYQASQRSDERTRMTLESYEIAAKLSKNPYPTLLETYISFESSLSRDEVLKVIHKLISSAINSNSDLNISTGCVDLVENSKDSKIPNILDNVASRDENYVALETKFDGLHPILIGPLSICNEIKNLLSEGDQVLLLKLKSLPYQTGQLGCLRISESIISKTQSKMLVQQYLIDEISSKESCSSAPSSSGEFEIGSSQIKVFTEGRWQELSRQGLVSQLQDNEKLFHVIQPKYCFMLNIDPSDMVVNFLSTGIADLLEQKIDSYFLGLPTDAPIAKRVYLAHERAWKEFGGSEYINFVKSQFFNRVAN